jgi:xanthine dehydrogenase small subunit
VPWCARAPLTDVWLRFASPPIRHAGTLGGNVANGSPIGDSPPVLMALDAQIELRRGSAVRRLPLTDFYLDYMKNALQEGEFVQAVAVPLAAFSARCAATRSASASTATSRRCAPALPSSWRAARSRASAWPWRHGRHVKCAAQAEAAILGQPWTQATVRAAQQA